MNKNMKQLGKIQRACLKTIFDFIQTRKRAPTVSEISQSTKRPGVNIVACLEILRQRGLVAWQATDLDTLRLLPAGRTVARMEASAASSQPGLKKARRRPAVVVPQAPQSGSVLSATMTVNSSSLTELEQEILRQAEELEQKAAKLKAMADDLHKIAS